MRFPVRPEEANGAAAPAGRPEGDRPPVNRVSGVTTWGSRRTRRASRTRERRERSGGDGGRAPKSEGDTARAAEAGARRKTRPVRRPPPSRARSTGPRWFRSKISGAFVEFVPGAEGLVHVSELANFRVKKVGDIVQIGDEITVKCLGVDERAASV